MELRVFDEDVKTADVFARITSTTSVRMLFSFDIDWKSEGYTEFTTDVNTTFCKSNM